MPLWKTDWSPYRYRCVQRLHQDNNKMLQQYAHGLEKEKKKKKSHTSIKSVVYPKQLLPLSYISRPYWRTSDTLLTFRSINNYCSLWDAERGFRDFTGKRHNLPVAVKQLQYVLSPSLFVLLWQRPLFWSQPAPCPVVWIPMGSAGASAPSNGKCGCGRDFECFCPAAPQQPWFTNYFSISL